MQRYLLVVLGMHRSGTSALTGAIAKAGAFPGTELMPATADNPEGYWECAPVVRLNERLLQQLGARWDSVVPLSPGWIDLPTIEALRPEAARIVATQFGDAKFAVVKDPRLCRLLPFWHDAFAEAGFALSVALMVRRPSEVAASLARRDQFAPEKSLMLWFAHLADSERESRGQPRAVVVYDALLDDPAGMMARVCVDAAFPLKATAAQRKSAAELVRPDLKRQKHVGARKSSREALASGLDTVLDDGYANLAALPAGQDPKAVVAALVVAAAPALAAAAPPWLAHEIGATQSSGQQRAADVDAAKRHIEDLVGQIDAARAAHVERDGIEAALRARTEELALTRQDMARLHETLRAEFVAIAAAGFAENERELREQVARLQQELGDERVTIAKLADQIDQARMGAQNQEQQIESARIHIDELVSQIDASRQAHFERDAREAAFREALEASQRELGATRAERDALSESARKTGDAVAALSAELDRRAAAERELAADRSRLGQLEREARERIAMIDGQLAESVERVRILTQQLEAASGELARIERRWIGRLARRVARG